LINENGAQMLQKSEVRRFSRAIVLVLAMVGCSQAQNVANQEDSTAVSDTIPGGESELVRIATEDLAARLDISPDQIKLTRFEEVTWPDGSIGCPRKNMRYTQALVNGSLIVLSVDGVDYQYHSGGSRAPFYCANPTPPVPGDGGGIDY
jgi:hypothetical protein